MSRDEPWSQRVDEHFRRGFYQGESVVAREGTDGATYWLDRATRGRQRLRTRLFDRKKRHYLDGFIARLRQHLEHQAHGEGAASKP
jgi:hypothetical protein